MKKSSSQLEFDLEIKKRRLRSDQVKALESSFEALNKLEPERKVQLAIELGLDPRQVAIWFQNRRARWKTKQLERDYLTLQSAYDDLKRNYDAVKLHNESLLHQIGEMKASMVDEDDAFGFSLNYEEPFDSKPIAVSSDSAMSEDYGTPNCVVSSYDIWPAAATCSFLCDEEPAPSFNWYCPPNPWT